MPHMSDTGKAMDKLLSKGTIDHLGQPETKLEKDLGEVMQRNRKRQINTVFVTPTVPTPLPNEKIDFNTKLFLKWLVKRWWFWLLIACLILFPLISGLGVLQENQKSISTQSNTAEAMTTTSQSGSSVPATPQNSMSFLTANGKIFGMSWTNFMIFSVAVITFLTFFRIKRRRLRFS